MHECVGHQEGIMDEFGGLIKVVLEIEMLDIVALHNHVIRNNRVVIVHISLNGSCQYCADSVFYR